MGTIRGNHRVHGCNKIKCKRKQKLPYRPHKNLQRSREQHWLRSEWEKKMTTDQTYISAITQKLR